MAQINVKAAPTHVTHEGAPAKRVGVEAELRRSVMACLLWEDTFYESGMSIAQRIALLCGAVEPKQIAAIAIEARERMKLRHVPLLLARILAQSNAAARHEAGPLLARIVQRPDELTEFLALYWKDGRTPISAQVKNGLRAAFGKFNAYSLAKYNRDGAVKLRDVLFLTHPKPRDEEQAATWKQLVEGTLPAPDTWEVALSGGADKRATWERLLAENKLGALALLRNLRNMEQAGVSHDPIVAALDAVSVERVLPFRFLAAAKYAPHLEPALERTMFRSLVGQPKLPGKTILLVDHSGSMIGAPVSQGSELDRFEAAAALAILIREACEDATIYAFSNRATLVPARRGFALRDALAHTESGGTYTEDAKQVADAAGYDRIIIVTDEQSHQALTAPKGKGYVVNVATYQRGIGYGTWTHIDGWSEAVLDYIRQSEAA